MTRLRIAPIVEGPGEVEAVPLLLRRIWTELLGGDFLDVLPPIRLPRTKLLKPSPCGGQSVPDSAELGRAIQLATRKVNARANEPLRGLILVLLDADTDCPAKIGPGLAQSALQCTGTPVACVLAKIEYETWFVGAAESLAPLLSAEQEEVPPNPESQRCGKKWVADRVRGVKYSETVDQAKMTALMDLNLCRSRCPSFDKLCRDLAAHLDAPPA